MYERLRKIYQLALHGVGGEQQNAQELLTRLLRTHNLTIDELRQPETKRYIFRWRTKHEFMLLMQVMAKVTNTHSVRSWVAPGVKQARAFELTAEQALEVEFLYREFCTAWAEEQEILLRAFVQRHEIFPAVDPEKVEKSTEEWEDLRRMAIMMDGLKELPLQHKRLNAEQHHRQEDSQR